MRVKKRNGSLQAFNMDKVKLTLERVSDDQGRPFTGADINRLTEAIEEEVLARKKEIIESAEVYRIVIDKLKEFGFEELAMAYEKFGRKFK